MELLSFELFATVQRLELDQDGHADDHPSQLLDEPHRRTGRSARRQQVVNDQRPVVPA